MQWVCDNTWDQLCKAGGISSHCLHVPSCWCAVFNHELWMSPSALIHALPKGPFFPSRDFSHLEEGTWWCFKMHPTLLGLMARWPHDRGGERGHYSVWSAQSTWESLRRWWKEMVARKQHFQHVSISWCVVLAQDGQMLAVEIVGFPSPNLTAGEEGLKRDISSTLFLRSTSNPVLFCDS